MARKSISGYLVRKYLRFDKAQPFITVSAFLAFLGVCVGVMVLLVAMAIMNGFDKEFERKLFTMNYPLSVYSATFDKVKTKDLEYLKDTFPQLLFSPYISSQVITKRGSQLEGGLLFGVDFQQEKKINSVLNKALKGVNPKKYDLIVGKEIKDSNFLHLGDKLILIFTENDPSGFSLMPRMKRFTYKGDFESGLIAYDKVYMYTTLESIRAILNYKKGTFDGIHIYSKHPFKDIEKIRKVLPKNLKILGWWQMNGNFFSALALEKRSLFIVLMLIILIASLNIISSLLMTVMSRRKEIALLFSLGATKQEIKKTFFYLGMIIGGGGIVIGTLLGLFSIYLLGNFDIVSLPADVYGTSKLPLELSTTDFFMILLGSIGIVAFSSYYPSYKATKINVLDTLRNE
ncbi:ABC transporter permease [Sulfurospirillum sp. 1612]|uniref:ABC transporter permease n=1 Tax=Sulfurospirillum sp. 1612 TaxID=3094835 RepID=UPI002F95F4AD